MGVTQYIGSRYVPVFADPADWNNTRTYEPLTIVMNEGNSYTSKQYVPKGIDISNEDYWALTGNYNAQVEQYRKDVLSFDGRITTADGTANNALSLAQTNKQDISTLDAQMAGTQDSGLKSEIASLENYANNTFVCIGDSYTAQFNWVERCARNCGCKNVINTGVGGTGYKIDSSTNPGNTFGEQVDKAITKAADYGASSVKQVIVLGGFNDIAFTTYDANSIMAEISNVYTKLVNAFPFAKIMFFPFQMVWGYHTKERASKIVHLKAGMNYAGIPFDSEFSSVCLCDIPLGTDKIHPIIEYGYWMLESYISSVLNGVAGCKSSTFAQIDTTFKNNVTGTVICRECNGYVNVYASVLIPAGFESNAELFTFNDAHFVTENNFVFGATSNAEITYPLISLADNSVKLAFSGSITSTNVISFQFNVPTGLNG